MLRYLVAFTLTALLSATIAIGCQSSPPDAPSVTHTTSTVPTVPPPDIILTPTPSAAPTIQVELTIAASPTHVPIPTSTPEPTATPTPMPTPTQAPTPTPAPTATRPPAATWIKVEHGVMARHGAIYLYIRCRPLNAGWRISVEYIPPLGMFWYNPQPQVSVKVIGGSGSQLVSGRWNASSDRSNWQLAIHAHPNGEGAHTPENSWRRPYT